MKFKYIYWKLNVTFITYWYWFWKQLEPCVKVWNICYDCFLCSFYLFIYLIFNWFIWRKSGMIFSKEVSVRWKLPEWAVEPIPSCHGKLRCRGRRTGGSPDTGTSSPPRRHRTTPSNRAWSSPRSAPTWPRRLRRSTVTKMRFFFIKMNKFYKTSNLKVKEKP